MAVPSLNQNIPQRYDVEDTDLASIDGVLSTTRSVRLRLDFDRHVDLRVERGVPTSLHKCVDSGTIFRLSSDDCMPFVVVHVDRHVADRNRRDQHSCHSNRRRVQQRRIVGGAGWNARVDFPRAGCCCDRDCAFAGRLLAKVLSLETTQYSRAANAIDVR